VSSRRATPRGRRRPRWGEEKVDLVAGTVRQRVVEDGAGRDGAGRRSSSALGRRDGQRRSVADWMGVSDRRRLMGRAAAIDVDGR
jgi:hypothetical protein